ncbi:MAG: ArgR family transcriptional regulator [Oscillospiraceae bacterium]|nr:ArgR family transcriptional regulator [Oscillospiraceae bacterium]
MKKQRQSKIVEIIEQRDVATQEDLKKYLEEEGIVTTQATLSRDINELNLKKQMSATGVYIYVRAKKSDMECPTFFRESVIEVAYAMNTVVIKCYAGMAQAACAALDKMNCDDVVGTIAGDDTIFALMKTEAAAAEFTDGLRSFLNE